MKYSAILAVLLVSDPASVVMEECPSVLVYQAPGLSRSDRVGADAYAFCMRTPQQPLAEQLGIRMANCSSLRLKLDETKQGSKAAKWVDHIATMFPGCETSLKFKRK